MRFMWALSLCGLIGLPAGQAQEAGSLDVKVVKYDALKEIVLQNRGKVVVVDFWRFS